MKLKTPALQGTIGSVKRIRWSQLWMSVIGTTISIALTFGTSAIFDYYKKKAEKHEMVLMILNDFSNTISQAEEIESAASSTFEAQLRILENPQTFSWDDKDLWMLLGSNTTMPAKTVENIFSSNIETVSTIGNILFTEKVSEFYLLRQQFFDMLNDNLQTIYDNENGITSSYQNMANHNLSVILSTCRVFLIRTGKIMELCKGMTDVSDAELQAFSQRRQSLSSDFAPEEGKENNNIFLEQDKRFQQAVKKGRGQ